MYVFRLCLARYPSAFMIQVLDSSSNGMSGTLKGYFGDFGDYDECLNAKHKHFSGKYCIIKVNIPSEDRQDTFTLNTDDNYLQFIAKNNIYFELDSFNFAVCIPSTCSRQQLLTSVRQYFLSLKLDIDVRKYCDTEHSIKVGLTTAQIISISIIAVWVLIVAFATIFDVKKLSHFNAVINTKRLFSPTKPDSEFLFLHGSRFYYLVFSISYHIWVVPFGLTPPLYSALVAFQSTSFWIFEELCSNGILLIESMFCISGLLTYSTWNRVLIKSGKLPFSQYMFARWLRTTPAVIAVMILTFIYPLLGSGPLFTELSNSIMKSCTKNWWKTLLYINNWETDATQICMPQTWYLSADFQLYILSYVIIVLLHRKPKLGLLVILLSCISTMIYAIIQSYAYNLPPYLDSTGIHKKSIEQITYLYFPTFHHINSYFSGIFIGFLISKKISPTSKFAWLFGWLFTFFLFGLTISIPHFWKTNFLVRSRFQELVFTGVFRTTYLSVFCWGLYAFAFNAGGLFQKLFEFPILTPVSRTSLSVVLFQFVFIYYDIGSRRQSLSFDMYTLLLLALRTLTACFLLGAVVYVVFELPFTNLLYSLIRNKSQYSSSEQNNNLDTNKKRL